MIRIVKANIFTSECQTLVNTVNCVGVMGTGLALEFKLRYPAMFDRYVRHCREGNLTIGKLWLYKPEPGEGTKWVLNFPTKTHWKYPSKESYLHEGLEKFVATYSSKGIESIAFPVLGGRNGRIAEDVAIDIMTGYLGGCDIDVEIYRHDPAAEDDLIGTLRHAWANVPDTELASRTGLRRDRIAVIREALEQHEIRTVGQLASADGVGEKSLARVFKSGPTLMRLPDQPQLTLPAASAT